MRIRVVRPDFWSDDTLGHMSDAVRLFYIGLWCLADDAGWLEWKPSQIGATLYPYRSVHVRERNIEAWGDALVQDGRLVRHPCGCGFIPTLTKHQRQGGNPSFQFRDKHRRHVADSDYESRQVRTDTPLEKERDSREGIVGKRGRAVERPTSEGDWEGKIIDMQRRGSER